MDDIQGWAVHFYQQHGHHLPDNVRHQIPHFASNPTYWSYVSTAYSYFALASSYITPILNTLIQSVSTKPDLATVALLLVIFFISLKILGMIVGTVLYWFRLVRTVALYGGLVLLATWMYAKGPAGCAEDVGHWWGVWQGFYSHYSEQNRLAEAMRQQGIPGGGHARWR